MRLKKNIATSEAGFAFNPGTGDSFSVNGMGAEILTLLKENKSQQEILKELSLKYDTESIQIEKDMEDFITQLSNYNLLAL